MSKIRCIESVEKKKKTLPDASIREAECEMKNAVFCSLQRTSARSIRKQKTVACRAWLERNTVSHSRALPARQLFSTAVRRYTYTHTKKKNEIGQIGAEKIERSRESTPGQTTARRRFLDRSRRRCCAQSFCGEFHPWMLCSARVGEN